LLQAAAKRAPHRFVNWTISWSDMPLRHRESGLPYFMTKISDEQSGAVQGFVTSLGEPQVGEWLVARLLRNLHAGPVAVAELTNRQTGRRR
jgi:hypothetical protein